MVLCRDSRVVSSLFIMWWLNRLCFGNRTFSNTTHSPRIGHTECSIDWFDLFLFTRGWGIHKNGCLKSWARTVALRPFFTAGFGLLAVTSEIQSTHLGRQPGWTMDEGTSIAKWRLSSRISADPIAADLRGRRVAGTIFKPICSDACKWRLLCYSNSGHSLR